jgi:hypothetical protein
MPDKCESTAPATPRVLVIVKGIWETAVVIAVRCRSERMGLIRTEYNSRW